MQKPAPEQAPVEPAASEQPRPEDAAAPAQPVPGPEAEPSAELEQEPKLTNDDPEQEAAEKPAEA